MITVAESTWQECYGREKMSPHRKEGPKLTCETKRRKKKFLRSEEKGLRLGLSAWSAGLVSRVAEVYPSTT